MINLKVLLRSPFLQKKEIAITYTVLIKKIYIYLFGINLIATDNLKLFHLFYFRKNTQPSRVLFCVPFLSIASVLSFKLKFLKSISFIYELVLLLLLRFKTCVYQKHFMTYTTKTNTHSYKQTYVISEKTP